MIVLNWFSNILYRHIIWVKKLNLFFPIQKISKTNIASNKNNIIFPQSGRDFQVSNFWAQNKFSGGCRWPSRKATRANLGTVGHGWLLSGHYFFWWPTWLGIPPNGGSKYGKKCWKKNSGLLVGVPFAFGTTFFGGGLTYRFQIFTSDMEEMMQNEEYLFPVCGQKIRTRTHSLFFCFSLVRWCDSVFSADFGEKTAKTCKGNHPFQATPELYT